MIGQDVNDDGQDDGIKQGFHSVFGFRGRAAESKTGLAVGVVRNVRGNGRRDAVQFVRAFVAKRKPAEGRPHETDSTGQFRDRVRLGKGIDPDAGRDVVQFIQDINGRFGGIMFQGVSELIGRRRDDRHAFGKGNEFRFHVREGEGFGIRTIRRRGRF